MRLTRTTHLASLVFATVTLVLLAASCGPPDREGPIVLVTRQVQEPDDFECDEATIMRSVCHAPAFTVVYRTDGHQSVGRHYGAIQWTVTNQAVLSVSCGGTEFGRANMARIEADDKTSRLEFDGGDEARLIAASSIQVVPFSDTSLTCLEEQGSWEGTAGRLQGRSGSYLRVENDLQTVLTLTDDG